MEYKIPLLTANDIECRIQSVSKNKAGKVGAVLLLYKNARVDMRILDEVFGQLGWQRTYELINGNLFCTIEIWDNEKKQWIKKQDVGVPSNTEAEKGEASDASKRAGTCVGIGRELYTAPFVYVTLNDGEWYESNGKIKATSSVKFNVTKIEYNDRREIVGLEIKDSRGGIAFALGGKYKAPKEVPSEKNTSSEGSKTASELICEFCGKKIEPFGKFSAQQIADSSKEKYGRIYCVDCAKREKERIAKMNQELKVMDSEFKGAVG